MLVCIVILFFKQKTAYEMRISDWSSDVCSSDLAVPPGRTATGTVDRVMIRATGDSWVQVRDAQGAALFTRVLREGDVYRVPEQSGLRLATGNAGALEILVDGTPAPSLGSFGEVVRHVLLEPAPLDRKSTRLNSSHYWAPRMP